MNNLDNLIIVLLLIIIIVFYFKKFYKKEHFEVIFPSYYPINSDINIDYNNYENQIEENRLLSLKEVLKTVKKNANNDNDNYKIFNKPNLPIIKKGNIESEKLKSLTKFLIENINDNFTNNHKVILKNIKNNYKLETDHEVKVNFRMICDYKIKINKKYREKTNNYLNENNKIIIDVELIASRNETDQSLHLNYLNLVGIESNYLQGKGNRRNKSNHKFTKSLSNQIVKRKKKFNEEEMKYLNSDPLANENNYKYDSDLELDDNITNFDNKDIVDMEKKKLISEEVSEAVDEDIMEKEMMDIYKNRGYKSIEDTNISDINTEEAESFFDI